jgi:hypothetical protein
MPPVAAPFLFKHAWVLFILVTFVDGALWWHRGSEHRRRDPSLAADYRSLVVIWVVGTHWIARAELIADQIGRFATQHLHQLAGHHANLAFWLAEAAAAARTIDEYQHRQFVVRLFHAGFVSEAEVRQAADLVGVSIEPEDLERQASET